MHTGSEGGIGMPLQSEQDLRTSRVLDVAAKMVAAARTAPKARGVDNLSLAVATGDVLAMLAKRMRELASGGKAGAFFNRDADNVDASLAVVLLGTRIAQQGVEHCGLCGFIDCADNRRHPGHPCVFNTGDLGIAVGSAVSVAMDERIDNRVMFSIGVAAKDLGLLGTDVAVIYGIPLSIGPKSPFFDRSMNLPASASPTA
jgi:uncharacterized ferredoxin-like protein